MNNSLVMDSIKILFFSLLAAAILLPSCSEDKLDEYDTSISALNIAKGTTFGLAADYPEEYSFNAYFLGSRVTDYTLHIPVRLQGVIDNTADRHYKVQVVDSASENLTTDVYTLDGEQTFRKGLYQDSIDVTIHVDKMDEEANYKMRIALVPGDDFTAGVPDYQYVDIAFTKNLSIAPALWQNNSKLRRIPYTARKCAVFLEISGLTDPNWTDDGSTGILDYWISLCQQWFEEHEEYDADGNRIYFE